MLQFLLLLGWCKSNCSFALLEFATCYWNMFLNVVVLYIILMWISHLNFFCYWLITCCLFYIYFRLWKCTDVRVLMYRCESWTIKKVEIWRTDAFELWCCRRLLRDPQTTRRSNQSILKEKPWIIIGSTDAEAPSLWPPDAKSRVTGKDLDAGKDWGQEKWVTEDEMVG